jgi:hypothetical protein
MGSDENEKNPQDVREAPISVLIGTPAYTGCTAAYMSSQALTLNALHEIGVRGVPYVLAGHSNISFARAEIGRTFQLYDFDYLLAIDSDIAWTPETVLRMLARARRTGAEFICACPPLRQLDLGEIARAAAEKIPNATRMGRKFTARYLGEIDGHGRLELDEEGFGKIHTAGLAFALIHKSVFQKLSEAHPELRYRATDKTVGWCLYNPIVRDEHAYGEDMAFVQRWRDQGGDVWLLADAPIGHEGPMLIEGNYAESRELRVTP